MTFRLLKLSLILMIYLISSGVNSQYKEKSELRNTLKINHSLTDASNLFSLKNNAPVFVDSLTKKLVTKKSISALFISVGGGISIPLDTFKSTANVTFGILGRLEFASTAIFPFVIGAQVDYFSYNSPDEFRTIELLTSYKTKILAVGLNIEYSLAKFLRSSFTMPFLTVDVKNNMIKREYDEANTAVGMVREETKISVGAGFGMTIFIFDFFAKYNYMKDNSFIGVYTKTRIPVIRF